MRGNLCSLCLRLAGVSTVMRTLPPQPPEGHQRRRRGLVSESAGLHALREVQFAFQSPREVPLCFSHHAVSIKATHTITDNETIGRVDRAIKRLRCDMTKHHRQSGKVGPLRPEFR